MKRKAGNHKQKENRKGKSTDHQNGKGSKGLKSKKEEMSVNPSIAKEKKRKTEN